jgi:hypothetical protein
MEYNSLFNCAVKPGFLVEGQRGELDPLPVAIARNGVPLFASSLRNTIVFEANLQFYFFPCIIKP